MLIDQLFGAKSVAVVGASGDPNKLSGRTVGYLRKFGFRGSVYPVNPKCNEIDGYRCYASIAELPGPVDLGVVSVPAFQAVHALEELAKSGCSAAIVYAAGFAEVGSAGVDQAAISEISRKTGMRILGPNSNGLMNLGSGLLVNFSLGLESIARSDLIVDDIGLVGQSGAVCALAFRQAQERGIGIRYIANTGNEADVTTPQIMLALAESGQVTSILGYIETLRDIDVLQAAARQARAKHISMGVILAGTGRQGSRAARSHTGALLESSAVVREVVSQFGISVVDSLEALLDYGEVAIRTKPTFQTVSPSSSPVAEVSIVTASGGMGVLMADAADRCGLRLTEYDEHTKAELRASVPAYGSVDVVVDTTAEVMSSPVILSRVLSTLSRGAHWNWVVVVLANIAEAAHPVIGELLRHKRDFPEVRLVVVLMSSSPGCALRLGQAGIPVFGEPVRAIQAIAKYEEGTVGRPETLAHSASDAPPVAAIRPFKYLTEVETKETLRACGMSVIPGMQSQTVDGCRSAVATLVPPYVAKVVSRQVLHKASAGLVFTNLRGEDEVVSAAQDIADRCQSSDVSYEGFLIEEMAPSGLEMLVTCSRVSGLGQILTVGIGGRWVEIINRTASRLLPVTESDLEAMFRDIGVAPLLLDKASANGTVAFDGEALKHEILSLAEFFAGNQEGECRVAEIELNPIIVHAPGGGVSIVDGLMAVHELGSPAG